MNIVYNSGQDWLVKEMYSGLNILQGYDYNLKKSERQWEWTTLKLIELICITQINSGRWWEREGKSAFLCSLVTI